MGIIKNNRLVQAGLSILIIVACYYAYNSDFFQEAVFPEKYWQKQVNTLEEVIEFNKGLIRSAYRDLKRIKMTAQLEVADYIDSAKMLGMTKEAARNAAVEKIREEIEANRDFIKEISDTNSKFKQEIEHARRELARHRNTR